MTLDLGKIREQFPALAMTDAGRRRIYLDNPAGTQVSTGVTAAMSDCMLTKNANIGAFFATSDDAGDAVNAGREAVADLLNAPSADEVIFGQNMTSLTLHLSRSLGLLMKPGDEIVLTRMDHDANVWPWVMLAKDLGLVVRWLPFNTETFEFDFDDLDALLSEKTRLVCVGGASNLTGTINDVKSVCHRARVVGALSFVDAVQSAPHLATDVQSIGCDFLTCSAYKFFGPHQGILWGRREVLEALEPYKVRPAPAEIPWSFETGTQSHEGIVGCGAAVDYFATIGGTMAREYVDDWTHLSGRRRAVHAAMDMLFEYEKSLVERLINGLQAINGVVVLGLTDPGAMDRRVPTVSFTAAGHHPDAIAKSLAKRGIFVWSGHNYAVEIAKALQIYDTGGAVRIGPVHYNSLDEIDETIAALGEILA